MPKIRIGSLFLALAIIAQCRAKEKRQLFNTIDLTGRLEDTGLLVRGKNYNQESGQTTTFGATRRQTDYKPNTKFPPILIKKNSNVVEQPTYKYKPPTYVYKPPVTLPTVVIKNNYSYEYTAPTYLPPTDPPITYLPPTNPPITYLPPTNPPITYLPPTNPPSTYLPPSTPGKEYLIPIKTEPPVTSRILPPITPFPITNTSFVYKPYVYKKSIIVLPVFPTPSPLRPFTPTPPLIKRGYVYKSPALKFLDEEINYLI